MQRRDFLFGTTGAALIRLGVLNSLLTPTQANAITFVGLLPIIATLTQSLYEVYQLETGQDAGSQYLTQIQSKLKEIEKNQSKILQEISAIKSSVVSTIEKNEIHDQNSNLLSFVKQYNRLERDGVVDIAKHIGPALDKLVYTIGAYSRSNYPSFLLGTCLQLSIYRNSPKRHSILRAMWVQKHALFEFAHNPNQNDSLEMRLQDLQVRENNSTFEKAYPSSMEILRYAKIFRGNKYNRITSRSLILIWTVENGEFLFQISPDKKLTSYDDMGLGISKKRVNNLLRKQKSDFVMVAYPKEQLNRADCVQKSGWHIVKVPVNSADTHFRSIAIDSGECLKKDFLKMEEVRENIQIQVEVMSMLNKSSRKIRKLLSNA